MLHVFQQGNATIANIVESALKCRIVQQSLRLVSLYLFRLPDSRLAADVGVAGVRSRFGRVLAAAPFGYFIGLPVLLCFIDILLFGVSID